MKKYAIVTDSTTYLSEEEFLKYGIKRASLNVIAGDETLRELEIDNSVIFKKFEEGFRLTTSQPSPGEFLDIYEGLVEEGVEQIFTIVLSDKLSGTYQSAKLAVNMLDNPSVVHTFNANMAALGIEMLILRLVEYIERDLSKEEIISNMENHISNSKLIMTSEDLTSIIRSGRLSKTKGMIGKILRIKPIIHMEDGRLDLLTSFRTSKKAMTYMLEYLEKELPDSYDKLNIRFCSHNSFDRTSKLKEQIQELYPDANITFSEILGPVFNVHVGPKGFGMSWYTE